ADGFGPEVALPGRSRARPTPDSPQVLGPRLGSAMSQLSGEPCVAGSSTGRLPQGLGQVTKGETQRPRPAGQNLSRRRSGTFGVALYAVSIRPSRSAGLP